MEEHDLPTLFLIWKTTLFLLYQDNLIGKMVFITHEVMDHCKDTRVLTILIAWEEKIETTFGMRFKITPRSLVLYYVIVLQFSLFVCVFMKLCTFLHKFLEYSNQNLACIWKNKKNKTWLYINKCIHTSASNVAKYDKKITIHFWVMNQAYSEYFFLYGKKNELVKSLHYYRERNIATCLLLHRTSVSSIPTTRSSLWQMEISL